MERWLRRLGALVLVAALGCEKEQGRDEPTSRIARVDRARLVAMKLAYEAYPAWLLSNPNVGCPDLAALNEYIAPKEESDPWGKAYVISCGPSSVRVHSVGEDGKDGTADDISSD